MERVTRKQQVQRLSGSIQRARRLQRHGVVRQGMGTTARAKRVKHVVQDITKKVKEM